MKALALICCFLLLAGSEPTASRRAFVLPGDLAGKTVLYVGAHPDDEWGAAPVLAEACIARGARCRFVVAADANSFGCLLTIGLREARECSRRRRLEMTAAAAAFGGRVEFLGLSDLFYAFDDRGRDRTIAEWAESSGGRAALVDRFLAAIRRARPRLLITFDPRHGSSCHAGHRATATLAIEAVNRLPVAERPEIWLEQTSDLDEHGPEAATAIATGGYHAWPDTRSETAWYDANRRLPNGRTAFSYLVEDRKHHATQVPDEASGKRIVDPPATLRFAPLAPMPANVTADFCTPLALARPTLDTPKGQALFARLMRDDAR